MPPFTEPSSPNSGARATDAADSPSTECPDCEKCQCWAKDQKIDYSGPDSKFVTSTQIKPVTVGFRLQANIASGKVIVTSIFKWGTIGAGVTAAMKTDTIAKFKQAVATWSGKFSLKVVDPVCGEKTVPISFELKWSPDDTPDAAPYHVNLHKTYPRAGVTGSAIDVGYDSDVVPNGSWVLTHEYGHTLCLQDEYFYAGVKNATVGYKRADGTTENITLEPGSPNIMFTDGSKVYLKRFFYFVEVEAQELLRSACGRALKCTVV